MDAVAAKVREVCEQYLTADQLLPVAKKSVEEARRAEALEREIIGLKAKIESMTAHLEKMYLDKLAGILDHADFERIYLHIKKERAVLEQKLSNLEQPDYSPSKQEDRAKALVQRFLDSAYTSRELLVSLIERVELTESKGIIIRFRFRQLEQAS